MLRSIGIPDGLPTGVAAPFTRGLAELGWNIDIRYAGADVLALGKQGRRFNLFPIGTRWAGKAGVDIIKPVDAQPLKACPY